MVRFGEYKIPGGKLVRVDFVVEDGCLRRVRVTGDFFLYPDDAIHALNRALEGATAMAAPATWADRIRASLPPATELLGFTPDDVAEAVRRALL